MHMAFFPGLRGVINHKNGIKTDNRLENLEVISSAENNAHAYRIGLRVPVQLRAWNRKLTDAQVAEATSRVVAGETQTAVALSLGVTKHTISRVCNKKSYLNP
jgi:hypothetical protein